ncbi:DUF29 domain-containing protein [Candidatus Synechococcus calcipolaris G9]|uniref:DUF29 domain-containing protein n=1 Tax=Candidatus Synechococcus calcipolaris G9 TaxID=1497997 RepID=A0ABT6F1Q8_9SYNE|nr:DUF29 domain-containing protein [Candidatus Synechococcus calcipolaris]MDG2991791.1 DUF29 domain-containing protein [Candidatus Synechococcus calcipolaris G9]
MQTVEKLYEVDYQAWVQATVAQLRAGQFNDIDLDALIEEIESLGRSERHALSSQWIRVVKHLLKLEAQPQARDYHNSWVSSVVEGLRQIEESQDSSPSLKSYLKLNQAKWYLQALQQASVETRIPQAQFPATCPYDVLDLIEGNYPESLRYFFVIE